MTGTALIITSISAPNEPLKMYAAACRDRQIPFIVIGDVPSPADFNLAGCDFWSMERQASLPFKLARILPERHYARKNLGYLVAISQGADVIVETDDDNLPREGFWAERELFRPGSLLEDAGWVNVYRYFGAGFIWPRGFPLERVREEPQPLANFPVGEACCPIQQGLADENPDIDAVYRLTSRLPFSFETDSRVILGRNSWCPFNSQNTTWFTPAFPLLYLPSYCSFRMTDIWRSFVAQRILWANGWNVLFHGPTVWQERNEHNLLRDFADEIPGYLNNAKIADALAGLDIRPGAEHLPDNLRACYRSLAGLGLVEERELPLLDAWLEDLGL